MLKRAAQQTALPGFLSELLAVALVGGSSVRQAKLNVTDVLDQYPIAGISLSDVQAEDSAPNQAITLAERAGVSVSEVLRAQAHTERCDAAADQDEAAARLGVKLMLPLGVCVLPAFVLLTVVPMTLSIFRQTSFS
jgi:tight adherence protein B